VARVWISIAFVAWAVQAQRPSGGVIAGRVTDEFGDPVIEARVWVESAGVAAPRPRPSTLTTTDDRGEYRVAGLVPGDYIVAVERIGGYIIYDVSGPVSFSSGRSAPETIYYPGASAPADAQPVKVVAGEERARIDFLLKAEPPVLPPVAAMRMAQAGARPKDPEATAALRGRVSAIDGRAVPHAHVELLPEVDLMQSAVTTADGEGSFEFRNLLPGRFRIVATKPGFAALDPNPADAASPASTRAVELCGRKRASGSISRSRGGDRCRAPSSTTPARRFAAPACSCCRSAIREDAAGSAAAARCG